MRLLLIIMIGFMVSGCTMAQKYEMDEKALDAFTEIKVEKGINLTLIPSDTHLAKIKTRNFSLGKVFLEIEGERLYITREGSSFMNSSVNVTLYFKTLTNIEASGGSDIEQEGTLKAEELRIEASGGSDISLILDTYYLECNLSGGSDMDIQGTSRAVLIGASGGSDIDADGLKVQNATLSLSGGSDADVYVTEELHIRASGGSDVNVRGNPKKFSKETDRSSDISFN